MATMRVLRSFGVSRVHYISSEMNVMRLCDAIPNVNSGGSIASWHCVPNKLYVECHMTKPENRSHHIHLTEKAVTIDF